MAAERRARNRGLWWLATLIASALAGAILFTSARVVEESGKQELDPSDAIVVFGAAQYDGRPSPVYRARLDHAFELYERHLAPVVITTGGFASDPRYSEGGVGHDYLMHRGIPEASLIAETQGSDTAQSAERLGVILRANHLRTCLAVSDAYHVFRIRKLLEGQGVEVHVAPRPDSIPHSPIVRVLALLKESASYLLWRLRLIV